jgi:prepilin peptidase CpaA
LLSYLPLLLGAAALTVVGCAALQDVRERLIANRYSIVLLLLAALQHAATAPSPTAWLMATGQTLAVAGALFLVGFLLWRMGGLGGGDVKLLVAAAFFVGPDGIIVLLVGTVLAGGVLALVHLAVGAMLPAVTGLVAHSALPASAGGRRSIPYGVAIATGAACAIVPSLPPVIG